METDDEIVVPIRFNRPGTNVDRLFRRLMEFRILAMMSAESISKADFARLLQQTALDYKEAFGG